MNDAIQPKIDTSSSWRTFAIAGLIALVVFSVFFWPLPRHFTQAIVENVQPPGDPTIVKAIDPGDPMQLMYHFWMFKDMLAGNTPWFHNLYEFNTGDDAARFEPSTYYFPFSLFFTVGFWLDGHTGGWNLASLLSIWLTVWFTFLLVRRYTSSAAAAWACTLLGLALPYRWMTLGGGSPTGFSMAWIPLLLLGIDRMVHERSISGGLIAGLAILLCSFTDSHCFFFSVLVTPAWFLFAWIHRSIPLKRPPEFADLRPTLFAGGLLTLFTAGAYLLQKALTAVIRTSTAKSGRTLEEVGLYTPHAHGLLSWNVHGVSEHIYIGYALIVMVVIGLAAAARAWRQPSDCTPARRWLIPFTLAVGGAVLAIMLSLGGNGPFGGTVFIWARELIPPYQMIRQTAKVYCLLPSIIAIIAALVLQLIHLAPARRLWTGVWLLVIAVGVLEANSRVHPRIGIVPDEQPAYAAVAADAQHSGRIPRAVAITLWPGESHYSAAYQHWGSLYHVRMVNGYFPFVAADYFEGVFRRLESINVGIIDDAQRTWLFDRGIDYVIVHENLYPEKVSPYPIGYTLTRLLEHPYLDLLAQSGPVWAFRLRHQPRTGITESPAPHPWPSSRWFEAETFRDSEGFAQRDPTASATSFVRLHATNHVLTVRPMDVGPFVNNHWALRVRGSGRLHVERFVMKEPAGAVDVAVQSEDWTWVHVNIPTPETRRQVHARLILLEGTIDIDRVDLLAGQPIALAPGEHWTIAAAQLFHAGYSSPDQQAVVFDPALESPGNLLYGPRLPFPPGTYEASVDFSSASPDGTPLGRWNLHLGQHPPIAGADMVAGQPLRFTAVVSNNLPLSLIMTLNQFPDPVTVRSITMKRID